MTKVTTTRPITGAIAIAFAIAFNIPYSLLAQNFGYPDILRHPAGEILDRFSAGGPTLVLIWYGFALAALSFVPLAMVLSVTPRRMSEAPVLATGALVAGALAGLTQAVGLMRWVFVVPGLADAHTGSAEARLLSETGFNLLNAYGGLAIGEHLGQLLTALFIALLAILQWREGRRIISGAGIVAATAILIGTGEGLALALRQSGAGFALFTTAGFLGLTLWLIMTGIGLIRRGDQA